jgi:aspartate ammonia-lyase
MTMMMVVVSIPMPITPISTVAIRTTVAVRSAVAVASSQSRPEQETQSELALGSSSINSCDRVIGGDYSRNFRTDWNSGGVGFQWHHINHLLGSAIRHHRQADLL